MCLKATAAMPTIDGSEKATNETFKEENDMNPKCALNVVTAAFIGAMVFTTTVAQAADSLPSWTDGAPRKSSVDFITLATTTSVAVAPGKAAEPARPRLILQITVDALRGDLPRRYAHVLGDGGFRYLMEHGINYTNAHYQHANTETIVGHASLATGAVPAAHGMVGNVWFDREQGRLIYNIEDPRYHLLTTDRKSVV